MSRVALLAPVDLKATGGLQQHVLGVDRILRALGHTVSLYSGGATPGTVRHLLRRWISPAQGAAFAREVADYPAFSNADYVLSFSLAGVGVQHCRHVHVLTASPVLHYASAARAGSPKALGATVLRPLLVALERQADGPNLPVACSGGLRTARATVGLPARQTIISPLPRWDAAALRIAKAEARARTAASRSGPCLLFAGYWDTAKGADRMSALIRALPAHWNVLLAVTNPSAVPRDIAVRACCVGRVQGNAMALFYRAADVLVAPARFACTSTAVIEAMTCKTAVLTTSAGVGTDLLAHGDLVADMVVNEPDSTKSWLEKLLPFEDPAVSRLMGAAAHMYARQGFSESVLQAKWQGLLESM